MIIAVACPSCERRYDVPDRLAGRMVRCKDCSHQFRVPVPMTLPARRKKKKSRTTETSAFDPFSDLLSGDEAIEPLPMTAVSHGKMTGRHLVRLVVLLILFAVIGSCLGWLVIRGLP